MMTYLVPVPVFVVDKIRFTIVSKLSGSYTTSYVLSVMHEAADYRCCKAFFVTCGDNLCLHSSNYVYGEPRATVRLACTDMFDQWFSLNTTTYFDVSRPYALRLNSKLSQLFFQSISRYDIPYLNARHNPFNITTRFRIR